MFHAALWCTPEGVYGSVNVAGDFNAGTPDVRVLYKITLTELGHGNYSASMPSALPAGRYHIAYYDNDNDSDSIFQSLVDWDGTDLVEELETGSTSVTDICNMALSHLGIGKELANMETDTGENASACRRFYENCRDNMLSDFPWPFATVTTDLGLVEEDLLPHLLAGEEVYCNFWINWKGIKQENGTYKQNLHLFNAEDFEELVPNLQNCVLVMDEIGQVLEPRAWEQESGNIRRFFQLHRHHHVDIYGTTQDISLVAKSAWIVVDEWIMCHNLGNNLIDNAINWLLKRETIKIGYQDMTYQEIRKLTYGWENFIDNPETGIGGELRKRKYDLEKLYHFELNENKEEKEHWYCEQCCGRQTPNKDGECPKHQGIKLIQKYSGLYDSDYDIPIKEKKISFVAMIDCPAGYRKIPYKGALSPKQIKEKQNLEK